MAKVSLNPILQRISGHVGGYVYKTINGKAFLAKKPVFRRRKWSSKQRQGHARLEAAADYANAVWKIPEERAFYEALRRKRKAWRAYSLATGDFLNPPTIESLEVLRLEKSGAARLRVVARDDVAVVRVVILVKRSTGKVLLERPATLTPSGAWELDVENWPAVKDVQIEVAAEDRPRNRTVKMFIPADGPADARPALGNGQRFRPFDAAAQPDPGSAKSGRSASPRTRRR